MKIKLGINRKSLNNTLKKVAIYDDGLTTEIRKANVKSSRELIKTARQNLKINGTDDTGRLRSSLAVIDTDLKGLIYNTGTGLSYAGDIEDGTPPHKLNSTEFSNLKDWTKRKLGVGQDKLYISTLSIARHIAEDGTDAQPFLMPAAAQTKPKHTENIQAAIKKYNNKR